MQKLNARHLVLALGLCASLVFLLYALRGRSGPGRSDGDTQPELSAARPEAPVETAAAPPAIGDVDFSRYEETARVNLFAPRSSRRAPARTEPLPPPPPLPTSTTSGASTRPPRPRPPDTGGWSYAGHVIIDGSPLAIVQNLENPAMPRCEYLAIGDRFLGTTVTEITSDELRIGQGNAAATLSRATDFSIVPLDRDASEASEQVRPGQAARPQGPRPTPRLRGAASQ
jgi:hypothetical protein